MCGILGYAGKVKPYRKTAFMNLMEWLFVSTQIRGRHAAGFFALRGNEILFDKEAVPADHFVRSSELWQDVKKSPPELMVAHCRWASHGAAEDSDNAHPFLSRDEQFGFVHNGVLRPNEIQMLEELGEECDTPVDSERILRFIERIGDVKLAVAWLFGLVSNGDYACVMGDAKDRRIWLWRNEGRPLGFLNLHEAYGVTVFFSTPQIFNMAYRDAFERKPNCRMMNRVRGFRSRVLYMLDVDGSLWKPDLPDPSKQSDSASVSTPVSSTEKAPLSVQRPLLLPPPQTVGLSSLVLPSKLRDSFLPPQTVGLSSLVLPSKLRDSFLPSQTNLSMPPVGPDDIP